MTNIDIPVDPELVFLLLRVIVIFVASIILVKFFNRLVVKVAEERLKVKKGRLIYVNRFFQLIIYSGAFFLILQALNIDVTGLVASLGIGALIIGFALREIIENWVSGLILISGRTYLIGDLIKVGNLTGVVTDISLRTTKLKTYDRNEIIIPNSLLLKDKIINLTGGKRETVASLILKIDYVFDIENAKKIIEGVLRSHKNVIVDLEREREIRFIVQIIEWTTEIEALFWVNEPENEAFIKSNIMELIKTKLEEENILPPVPTIMRRDYLPTKKNEIQK